MPSNRSLRSDDVDGFMLSAWDSWLDLESDYGVQVQLRIEKGKQRGHHRFYAEALYEPEGCARASVATAEAVWPTHYSTSVHALLYSLLVRLWRELDQWKLEQELAKNSSATDEPAEKL